MAVDRSWRPEYLHKQHEAMRWLVSQGFSLEEIRELRWGRVDEGERTLSVIRGVVSVQYDLATGVMRRDEHEREFKIPLKETECEWFFLRSKICCPWMFTREEPKTWRREGSAAALYSLSDIQKICGKTLPESTISELTSSSVFGNIEVSNLNITRMETKELVEKAMVG